MITQQAVRPTLKVRIRTVRPSLVDLRFRDDAWIVDKGEGVFAVCVGNSVLARVRGLGLDLPTLNHLFDRARHRLPRRRR